MLHLTLMTSDPIFLLAPYFLAFYLGNQSGYFPFEEQQR